MIYVTILATIMAVLGIIGYLTGLKSSLMMAGMVWGGLLLIARAGSTVAKVVNSVYYGLHAVFAGTPAFGAGERIAAASQLGQRAGAVKPLMSSDSAGPEFLVVLLILVGLSLVFGFSDRLRGPQSKLGLVLGMCSGYLVGGFLLNSLASGLGLVLPFGLTAKAAAHATAAPRLAAPTGGQISQQLARLAESANETAISWAVMLAIAAFIIGAIRFGNRNTKAR